MGMLAILLNGTHLEPFEQIDNTTDFQPQSFLGSGEKNFFKFFTIYGHGSHLT